MKIIVKAKTRAKVEKVERVDQPTLGLEKDKNETVTYKVSVKEAPVDGKANEAIIKALAKYFDVAPSTISLVTGQTSKMKVFMIK
jgi:uncharacterized protein YggU (UPF0235/DUF167 family)